MYNMCLDTSTVKTIVCARSNIHGVGQREACTHLGTLMHAYPHTWAECVRVRRGYTGARVQAYETQPQHAGTQARSRATRTWVGGGGGAGGAGEVGRSWHWKYSR